MKLVLALMLLLGVAIGAVYFFGGFRDFDPSEQGRKAKAGITPGMTWQQVVTVAGEPKEYRPIMKETKGSGANKIELFKPGGPSKFVKTTLTARVGSNELPHGFVIDYQFSGSEAFRVTFDETGSVVEVADLMTMNDLLNYTPTR